MRRLVFVGASLAAMLSFGDMSNYKWAVIGDSLSDPVHPSAADAVVKYYHFLSRDAGIQVVYTNAVGGTGYKAGYDSGRAFCQRLEANAIPSDVDVVTIFGSVNDGGQAATDEAAGNPEDRLPESETLAAYINKTIDLVQSQTPNARLVLVGGLYYCNAHPDRHIRANNTLRAVAAARGVEFHDWLTENPGDPLDFHQIEVNTRTEGSFARQYTIDWERYPDSSFGHPNDTYNEAWLAPHFGEILTASLMPTLTGVTAAPAATNATISGKVATLGVNATACDVYVAFGKDPESLGTATRIASGLDVSDTFTCVVSNLEAGTAYCYALSVSNNASLAAGTCTTGSFRTKRTAKPVGDIGFFAKMATFTIEYNGADPLSAIPVLVKLAADSPVGFMYSDCEANGSDICFADSEGNAIPFEIDTWNTSGESLVWVKVPSVAKGTAFTMYYSGTPAAANDPSAVWSDYTGVWHLNDLDSDTTPYSQGLYQNSTAVAGIDGHLSTNSIAGESGRFGKAFRVNGSTDWNAGNYNEGGAWINDSGEGSPLDAGGVFTIAGWFKHQNWHYNYDHFFYKRLNSDNTDTPNGSFAVDIGRNNFECMVQARGSSNARVRLDNEEDRKADMIGEWVYLAVVYDGTTCRIYENGELCRSGTVAAASDNDAPLVFGNTVKIADGLTGTQAWNGWIDEVRYLRTAKSADWIAAEYAAMSTNAFVAAGEVEDVGVTRPPALGAVAVAATATDATISGTIASHGTGATACDVYLAIGPSADALGEAVKIAEGATYAFEYTISGLSPRTTYHYGLFVTNNAESALGAATNGCFATEATSDFQNKVTFTVGYDGADPLSAMPVLVKLASGSPDGFDYRDCAAGGGDIRFFDSEGKAIPHEIDTWNTSGESLVWVKVPSVAKGTTFTMRYSGTPAAANDPSAVWGDYTGVWHLNSLDADETACSQGIYRNSTATAGIDGHLSAKSVADESGKFGKSFRVNDSTGATSANYKEGGVWVSDAGADSPLDAGGVFTISGWFKHANWNYYYDKIFFKRPNENSSPNVEGSFASLISANTKDSKVAIRGASSARLRLGDGGASEVRESMIDNWVYLTFVFNGTTCSIYENGQLCKSGTIAAASDNDYPLVFGNNTNVASGNTGDQAWNGWIDEVRFLKGTKSAAWIAAEYAAMAGDGFVTAGAVERPQKGLILSFH